MNKECIRTRCHTLRVSCIISSRVGSRVVVKLLGELRVGAQRFPGLVIFCIRSGINELTLGMGKILEAHHFLLDIAGETLVLHVGLDDGEDIGGEDSAVFEAKEIVDAGRVTH